MDTSVGPRRRVWPEMLKREIVAAASVPGASVSAVARHYHVNANLVFTWRRLFGAVPMNAGPQLVPVAITPDQSAVPSSLSCSDVIEIELPRGYRIRMGASTKAAALRLVLDVLERR